MGYPESRTTPSGGAEGEAPEERCAGAWGAGEGELFQSLPEGRAEAWWEEFRILGDSSWGGRGKGRGARKADAGPGRAGDMGVPRRALGACQRRRTQVPPASVSLIVKWEDAPPALAFSPVGPREEH